MAAGCNSQSNSPSAQQNPSQQQVMDSGNVTQNEADSADAATDESGSNVGTTTFKIPEMGIQFQTKIGTDLYYDFSKKTLSDGVSVQVAMLGSKSLAAADAGCKVDASNGPLGAIQKYDQAPSGDMENPSLYKKVGNFYIRFDGPQDFCATTVKGKAILSDQNIYPGNDIMATVEVIK